MFSDRKRPTELLILTLKKNKAASQVVASDVQAQTDPPALASLPGSAHWVLKKEKTEADIAQKNQKSIW